MATKNQIGLEQAIKAAGGVVALAKKIKVSHQAVAQWDEIPVKRIVAVEKATGVPREILRPDLYRQEA